MYLPPCDFIFKDILIIVHEETILRWFIHHNYVNRVDTFHYPCNTHKTTSYLSAISLNNLLTTLDSLILVSQVIFSIICCTFVHKSWHFFQNCPCTCRTQSNSTCYINCFRPTILLQILSY